MPLFRNTSDKYDTEKVKYDHLELIYYGKCLSKIVEALLHNKNGYSTQGFSYFHFFTGLVLISELEYFDDILVLSPKRTVEVIARTIIEGYIKLKWVEIDPKNRANRWFVYSYFQEWKYIIRQQSTDGPEIEGKEEIRTKLIEFAKIHLNDEGQKVLAEGKEINPFGHIKNDWSGKSMHDLAEATNELPLFSRYYDPMNDWVHWSPKGIIKSASTSKSGVQYSFQSYSLAAASIISSMISILGCINIWNKAYGIEPEEEQIKFINWFTKWAIK
jgi:hypothetical protein